MKECLQRTANNSFAQRRTANKQASLLDSLDRGLFVSQSPNYLRIGAKNVDFSS